MLLFLAILVVSAILFVILITIKLRNEGYCSASSSCQGGGDGEEGGLLPIMEPQFNLRECVKQLLLLEDHLSNPQKRCPDCIKKHCLTIEALAEEGVTLDKDGSCRGDCNDLAKKMREIEKKISLLWSDDLGASGNAGGDTDESEIAQELRQIRKPLMNKYFS